MSGHRIRSRPERAPFGTKARSPVPNPPEKSANKRYSGKRSVGLGDINLGASNLYAWSALRLRRSTGRAARRWWGCCWRSRPKMSGWRRRSRCWPRGLRARMLRIAVLERRLNRSSQRFSSPPSVDPPNKKPKRGKDPSGRSQGAQSGHEGHGRELLPLSAVDEVIEHWPERCECGHTFAAGDLLAVGETLRHQVEELPVISAQVIEHRAQRVCCPGCGRHTRAEIPSDIAASTFGPRFQAAVAALSVRNRVSRRDVVVSPAKSSSARASAPALSTRSSRASRTRWLTLTRICWDACAQARA